MWDAKPYNCSAHPEKFNGVDLCPLDLGGLSDGCQPPNLITTLINIALVRARTRVCVCACVCVHVCVCACLCACVV